MNARMKQLTCSAALLSILIAAPGIGSAASYTVQPNDSLWLIATKNGVNVEQLKKLNSLNTDELTIGQTLQVPNPPEITLVKVQQNDTMWKIAQRHNVPLIKLIRANPQIANPYNIWMGLDIRIPKKPGSYLTGVFPLKGGSYTPFTNTYADSRTWSPGGAAVRSHEGVDIFADKGTPVYSALGGKIVKAAWNEYGGWRVTVRVDDNTEFYYAHLSKYAAGIKEGVTVKAGQLIGYVGSTGYGTEGTEGKFLPHLHFGIYKLKPTYAPIDPYLYLKWWSL
ncbi:LysM peptidoglycan-binding domain-containing protein [Paenibacillus harenae]|uniref:LysM peptidoglycan-binding domain-containing protein n=1 Tax=Paenibacillus harenae TaxID=306543 RepID=UPI0027D80385|nr:M23 family metallopeptidase [Paenibacillus harenae]